MGLGAPWSWGAGSRCAPGRMLPPGGVRGGTAGLPLRGSPHSTSTGGGGLGKASGVGNSWEGGYGADFSKLGCSQALMGGMEGPGM